MRTILIYTTFIEVQFIQLYFDELYYEGGFQIKYHTNFKNMLNYTLRIDRILCSEINKHYTLNKYE